MTKIDDRSQIEEERAELIGWCTLLSSYNKSYFENKSIEELRVEYRKLSGHT